MPAIIKSTATYTPRPFKILVHGKPGTGKTISTATAPAPLLVVTEKGGHESLSPANIERVYGAGRPDISYDIPMVEAFDYTAVLEVMAFLQSPEAAKFQTVIFDSISHLSTILLNHFKSVNTHGLKAYGEMAEESLKTFQILLDLPMCVIFNAHAQRIVDGPDGSIVKYIPSFEGKKLTEEIPYYFSEWYYTDTEFNPDGSPRFILRTQKSPLGEAKTRFGHLDPVEEPHWFKIFKKLHEGNTKSATSVIPEPVAPIHIKKTA